VNNVQHVDYNIELAHIYSDEHFGPEHEKSISVALEAARRLDALGKTYCFSVLIDNYNPEQSTLDVHQYLSQLKEHGVQPDYYCYESNLTSYSEHVLNEASDRVRLSYEKYIARKGKHPCSLLLTVWHIMRLGGITNEEIIHRSSMRPVSFKADRIITIVPERFRNVEEIGQKILLSSPRYRSLITRMEQIYF
jgi:hypothetical protein